MDLRHFYRSEIETICHTEFPLLSDKTYVDHAGTTLYARSQLAAVQTDLLTNVYGNPHSNNSSSTLTTDNINQVRMRILRHFNTTADDYCVVFTAGCTGALKLLAETFQFFSPQEACKHSENLYRNDSKHQSDSEKSRSTGGCFCYLLNNHTSVHGMREVVEHRVDSVICLDESQMKLEVLPASCFLKTPTNALHGNGLFAYPVQSNFCGRKYPLDWIEKIHEKKMPFQKATNYHWYTLLDAAAYVSTSNLDLDCYRPDFVTLSFYKMFGFPTGLGCLLVRKECAGLLRKTYYGGGTVAVNCPTEWYHVDKQRLSDRLEDGTCSFLDIISLSHGFDVLERIGGGISAISQHTFCLSQHFHHRLAKLHHSNGGPVAIIYCHNQFEDITTQGPIVNFNLKRSDGSYIGYAMVDNLAHLYGIHLRTGCFCNVGACQQYLGLTAQDIKDNFQAGHECGDNHDLINGRPTGSLRISFGYMSTWKDVETCLKFICECFLENRPSTATQPPKQNISSDLGSDGKNPNKVEKFMVSCISTQEATTTKHNVGLSPKLPGIRSGQDNVLIADNMALCEESSLHNVSVLSPVFINDNSIHPPDKHQDHFEAESRIEATDSKFSNSSNGVRDVMDHSVLLKTRQLTDIYLYPVKSCAAFQVSEWEIGPCGLLYDREWLLMTEDGKVLGSKQEARLCFIKPEICLEQQTLVLKYPDLSPLVISLTRVSDSEISQSKMFINKVCGDSVSSVDCGDEAADWLAKALLRPTRLVRQKSGSDRDCKTKSAKGDEKGNLSLSFANKCQYLLLSWRSLLALQERMFEESKRNVPDLPNLACRFRGNLLVGGGMEFEEETWDEIKIGSVTFFNQGSCSRCQMICIDPQTAERNPDPLSTLMQWRGGKVPFGIYLTHQRLPGKMMIRVGDSVTVVSTVSA